MTGKHYHFIGIGGIGMSGIAHLMLRQGVEVSGSDAKLSAATAELESLGAKVFAGHNAGNIKGATTVVYSSAIKDDNPEMIEAHRLGIPVIKRAQALALLMKDKVVIAVTGSHGKTTTTSLAAYLLLESGFMPTVAVGGILKNIDTNACFGNGRFFVAEADESDGSFLYYDPAYSIITNIDREHLDYYKDFGNELRAFGEFIAKTKPEGCVFCCSDDANIMELLKAHKGRRVLFGLKDGADIYSRNIELKELSSSFDCYSNGKLIGRFDLALGGKHNISNALSVIALALELGIETPLIRKAFSGYKGAKRRLEIKFNGNNIMLIDDYAHHPTEIKATLDAAAGIGNRRVIAVFQPHRYSRTQNLLQEFASSFDKADQLIITDIYAASEPPIEGVSGELLYKKIKECSPDKDAIYLPKDKIIWHILNTVKPQDLVITLGAGDIVKVCDELAEELKKQG